MEKGGRITRRTFRKEEDPKPQGQPQPTLAKSYSKVSRRSAVALEKDDLSSKRQPALQRSNTRPVGATTGSKPGASTITNVQKESSQQARRRGGQQRPKVGAKADGSQQAAAASGDVDCDEKA